jgi:hypothetical protein
MWLLGTAVALPVIAIGGGWLLSYLPPSWYQPPTAGEEHANELAAAVELRLAEELHKIRQEEPVWAVRIREEQINAWLATRMPKWLEHERGVRWPAVLGSPQVRLEDGRMSVAVPIAVVAAEGEPAVLGDLAGRIVTLVIQPYLEDGELRLTLSDIRIGRLPVPGDPIEKVRKAVGDRLDDRVDGDVVRLLVELLLGETGIEPVARLVDNRQVIVREIYLRRGVMDVRAETLSAAEPQPH